MDGKTLGVGEEKTLKVSGNSVQNQLSVTTTHLSGVRYNICGLPFNGSHHFPQRYDSQLEDVEATRQGDDVVVETRTRLDISDLTPCELMKKFGAENLTEDELREVGFSTLFLEEDIGAQTEWSAYKEDQVEVFGVTLDTSRFTMSWALARGVMSETIREHINENWKISKKSELRNNAQEIAEKNDFDNEPSI